MYLVLNQFQAESGYSIPYLTDGSIVLSAGDSLRVIVNGSDFGFVSGAPGPNIDLHDVEGRTYFFDCCGTLVTGVYQGMYAPYYWEKYTVVDDSRVVDSRNHKHLL